MRKLKNKKYAIKDEVTIDMIKGGGDKVVDWIWRLCNMAFESSAVPEDWRSVVTVPLNKGKSHSVGRPWKRWINTVKDCLKKERERKRERKQKNKPLTNV